MPLTREEKETLRQRYETWGVEAVRHDLANPERAMFVDPDVDEFAHSWIAEQEMKGPVRGDTLVKFMMIVAGVEFGVMVGQNLSSFLG